MIEEALTYVKGELQSYLVPLMTAPFADVVLDNIANYDSAGAGNMINKAVISVVNLEEESTLKNNRFQRRNTSSGLMENIEPPVHLNLYLLFCSTPPNSGGSAYEFALRRLSYIVQHFQSRKNFETNVMDGGVEHKIRLVFDLYTLTFEQINHLWGSLGGKQLPFVMYKARLIKIQDGAVDPVSQIEEIELKYQTKL